METIRRDFLRGELGRLARCAAGFAVCLLVLWYCWPQGRDPLPLLLAGVAGVLALAALRAAVQAGIAARDLNDGDLLRLSREYAAPHPVCRVWQGEAICCLVFLSAGAGAGFCSSLWTGSNRWRSVSTGSGCCGCPL